MVDFFSRLFTPQIKIINLQHFFLFVSSTFSRPKFGMQIFLSHFSKTGLQHCAPPKNRLNRQPRRQNNNNIQSVSDRSASPRLIAYICLNFSSAFVVFLRETISTSNDRRMPARFFAAILGTASAQIRSGPLSACTHLLGTHLGPRHLLCYYPPCATTTL